MWLRIRARCVRRSGRRALILSSRRWIWSGRSSVMLDANLKSELKGYLARISQPVEMIAAVDGGDESRKLLELLNDIEALSGLLSIAHGDEAEPQPFVPSFALRRPGAAARVRFAGLPMGHEFTSLVLALLQAGGHPPKLEEAVAAQIRGLDGDFEFETF